MSFFSQVSIADGQNLDAFSRLRVANPETLLAIQQQYNNSTIQMESGNTGTGVAPTYNTDVRWTKLSATAGSGTSYMQSYEYTPYQPGKSQFVALTGKFDTGVAGAVADIGYFDAKNGIFLRQNGASGLQLVRRTSTSGSTVDNAVSQASWNVDPMDGTGPSGITLVETNVFILVIDLQFLGMGRVRVGFDIGGVIYHVHQFLNANVLTVPYMQSASLPIQILLTATSTGATQNCYFKCATVMSEGGYAEGQGYTFCTGEGTCTAGSGARTHLISIRPKTTFNGLVNREAFALESINLLVTGNYPVFWELGMGATFSAAPTWVSVDATYSAFEYATGGTLSTLPMVMANGYCAATNQSKDAISRRLSIHHPLALDRSGAVTAMNTFTVVVSGIGGGSDTRGTLNFTETR
jgi:hypothetical protein